MPQSPPPGTLWSLFENLIPEEQGRDGASAQTRLQQVAGHDRDNDPEPDQSIRRR